MTPNLAEIRAALAAAKGANPPWRLRLEVHAPTWLAHLCNEVERLRVRGVKRSADMAKLVAERDAALRERDELARSLDTSAASLEAAIAEVERLIATIADVDHAVGPRIEGLLIERDAWRACAEQLAAAVRMPDAMASKTPQGTKALARYDALKAGES